MDQSVKWFSMPIEEQFCNIGSEVNRAVRWRKRNDYQKAANFCKKAISFLELTKQDPKNKCRVNELNEAIYELRDHFLGEDEWKTDDETLIRYYDAFLFRIR